MKRKTRLLLNISFASLLIGILSVKENNIIANAGSNEVSSPQTTYKNDTSDATSYYNSLSIEGLQGEQLLNRLATTMQSKHRYYTSYDDIKGGDPYSDEDPNDESRLICFYSGESIPNLWSNANVWNREHVWCQSLTEDLYGTGNAGADVHQLRPTINSLNSTRNNRAYAEIKGLSNAQELIYNNKKTGNYYIEDDTVGTSKYATAAQKNGRFEPRDAIKGDVARILLYMYTHYSKEVSANSSFTKAGAGMKFNNIIYTSSGTKDDCIKLLLKWNKLDPVDAYEANRNDYCASVTGLRNPYIDHPEFANMIFDSSYSGSGALKDGSFIINDEYKTVTAGTTYQITPSSYSNALSYSSSDSSVATVSSSGLVTLLNPGEVEIVIKNNMISKEITLYVSPSNGKCAVNFYLNDGTNNIYKTIEVDFASNVSKPINPTSANYTLEYWCYDTSGENEYSFTHKVRSTINLYAKWIKKTNGYYQMIKSTSDLEINKNYLIVTNDTKLKRAVGNTSSNSNFTNRSGAEVTINSYKIEQPGSSVQVFKLVKGKANGTYSFYGEEEKKGYLSYPGGSKNQMTTVSNLSDNTSFLITIESTGIAKIVSNPYQTYSIQYNSSADIFSCYSSSQKPVSLYKLISDGGSSEDTYKFEVDCKTNISFDGYFHDDKAIALENYCLTIKSSFALSSILNSEATDLSKLKFKMYVGNNGSTLSNMKSYDISNVKLESGVVTLSCSINLSESDLKTKKDFIISCSYSKTNIEYYNNTKTTSYVDIAKYYKGKSSMFSNDYDKYMSALDYIINL